MYFLTAIKFSTPHFLFINKIPSLKNAAIRLKIRGKNISQKFGFTHEHDDVYSKSILGDKEANILIKGNLQVVEKSMKLYRKNGLWKSCTLNI